MGGLTCSPGALISDGALNSKANVNEPFWGSYKGGAKLGSNNDVDALGAKVSNQAALIKAKAFHDAGEVIDVQGGEA